MSTATEITQKAMDSFLKNRDLLACLKQTPEEVFERTSAAASLDKTAREEMGFFVQHIDQQDAYARKVAREDLHKAIYATMARAFIKCLTNGAITQAMKLTNEADSQLLELKYLAGTEQRPAPKPVVPVKSAQQILDDQIRDDWAHLSADKIRLKQNDPAYRRRLEELLNSDAIKSQATSKFDIGEVGG